VRDQTQSRNLLFAHAGIKLTGMLPNSFLVIPTEDFSPSGGICGCNFFI